MEMMHITPAETKTETIIFRADRALPESMTPANIKRKTADVEQIIRTSFSHSISRSSKVSRG